MVPEEFSVCSGGLPRWDAEVGGVFNPDLKARRKSSNAWPGDSESVDCLDMGVRAANDGGLLEAGDCEAEAAALRRLTMEGVGLIAGDDGAGVYGGEAIWKDSSWLTKSRWNIE